MFSLLLVTLLLLVGTVVSYAMLAGGALGATWLTIRNRDRHTRELLEARGFDAGQNEHLGELSNHTTLVRRASDGHWLVTMEGLPADLALRMSTTGTKGQRTGDRAIDDAWSIGTVEGGIGRLGRQARVVLHRLRHRLDSLVLSGGTLTAKAVGGPPLMDTLTDLAQLASELHGDPLHLLVDRIRTDPDPRVRGQMLWELAQHDRALARETVERRDPTSNWGAEELLLMGELMGRPKFLAQALDHEGTSLRLAARIASAWVLLDSDVVPLLEQLATDYGPEGVAAAAEHMRGAHGHHAPALIPWIRHLADHNDQGPTVQRAMVSVVRTLQETEVVAALPELVHAAQQVRGPGQLRILNAIGTLGGIEHVGALRALQGRLAVTEFQAQRAIEQAVANIQGRGSGEVGALSIAAPIEGAGMLALAASTGGGLAVASSLPAPAALPQEEPVDDAVVQPPSRAAQDVQP